MGKAISLRSDLFLLLQEPFHFCHTVHETMAQVVETAIGLEKESILFYIGLKDIVPPQAGSRQNRSDH